MPMPRPVYIALHDALAGIFFYVVQRFMLSADTAGALTFAAAMAVAAGGLAYYQTGR